MAYPIPLIDITLIIKNKYLIYIFRIIQIFYKILKQKKKKKFQQNNLILRKKKKKINYKLLNSRMKTINIML